MSKKWWDKEIKITLKLTGNFVDFYHKFKPKDMPDSNFVNAIVSSWLMDKENTEHDKKKAVPKGD